MVCTIRSRQAAATRLGGSAPAGDAAADGDASGPEHRRCRAHDGSERDRATRKIVAVLMDVFIPRADDQSLLAAQCDDGEERNQVEPDRELTEFRGPEDARRDGEHHDVEGRAAKLDQKSAQRALRHPEPGKSRRDALRDVHVRAAVSFAANGARPRRRAAAIEQVTDWSARNSHRSIFTLIAARVVWS